MAYFGSDWPRTPRGKAICPICGLSGWPGGKWMLRHREHVQVPCGKWRTSKSASYHRGKCIDCKLATSSE